VLIRLWHTVTDIRSAFASAITSLTDLPTNPATSSGCMPRVMVSLRKNTSALKTLCPTTARGRDAEMRKQLPLASADEYRALASSFEAWAETAATAAERQDFLKIAMTMRNAAAELDASAATVRQLEQRKK
jgi:hypothetical protein